jgi:hypothetical protein
VDTPEATGAAEIRTELNTKGAGDGVVTTGGEGRGELGAGDPLPVQAAASPANTSIVNRLERAGARRGTDAEERNTGGLRV